MQYEYVVSVASLTDPIATLAQHYGDRGDAENIYDEEKNQWAGVAIRSTISSAAKSCPTRTRN